jgi:hypothetical protein
MCRVMYHHHGVSMWFIILLTTTINIKKLHFSRTRIPIMNLLQISYDFSYRLAMTFYGFRYDDHLIHMSWDCIISATLIIPCVRPIFKKLRCGMPRQLLLMEVKRRTKSVTEKYKQDHCLKKFFYGIKIEVWDI